MNTATRHEIIFVSVSRRFLANQQVVEILIVERENLATIKTQYTPMCFMLLYAVSRKPFRTIKHFAKNIDIYTSHYKLAIWS